MKKRNSRLWLIAVFVVAVPDREAPPAKDKPKPVQQEIIGDWQLVNGVIGGKVPPKDVGGTVGTWSCWYKIPLD